VKDVNLNGKKVIIRVDFNVPLDANGAITDDTRIQAALPTIQYILEQGASLIIMSHLGRPKGEAKPEFSLKPCAVRLGELLDNEVHFINDCIGAEVEKAAAELQPGDVLMLENTRFHNEEKKNDDEFSKKLASLADVYVNDAFGSAHRAHASTEGITKYAAVSVAGFLLEKEIQYLANTLASPEKPFVVIVGGAKVSSKLNVFQNLLDKVDCFLVAGGMAYTFLKSKGLPIGRSLIETEMEVDAFNIMKEAHAKEVDFRLPLDHVVVEEIKDDAKLNIVGLNGIQDNQAAVDIGPKTIADFKKVIAKAKTIVWNGPMGIFEIDNFAKGTFEVAKALAASKAKTIVGGGDSVAALKKAGLTDKITHVSTGGGASLEMLEGKLLPGLAALDDK